MSVNHDKNHETEERQRKYSLMSRP